MTFPTALSTTVPANGDQVSQGAQRIRELASAVRERLDSLVVNVDTNPLVLKAGAVPSGYALAAPVITGGQMNNASFANPTFSGTITGLPSFNATCVFNSLATTIVLSNAVWTDAVGLVLTAGTWLLTAHLHFVVNNLTTDANLLAQARVRNAGSTVLCTGTASLQAARMASNNALSLTSVISCGIVYTTAGETVTLQGQALFNNNAAITGSDGTNPRTVFYALRIG